MISTRLPWRPRARPSATLHEIPIYSIKSKLDKKSTTGRLVCQARFSLRCFLILAVEKVAHRLPPSLVRFARSFALFGVHAALGSEGGWFRGAAFRAAVSETCFIRLQLERFSA